MDIKKKNILLGVLIIGILSMTIAFATLSTRLNIGGTAEVTAQNWKIVINNWTRDTSVTSAVEGQTNTAEEVTPGLPANNTVSVSGLVVRFKQPGDRVKYTFNIANEGTIYAELQSWTLNNNLTCTSNNETVTCPTLEKEIVCGNPLVVPEVGDELAANSSITCIYTLTYPEVNGSNEYEKSTVTISGLGANWTYVQKEGSNSNTQSPGAQIYTLTLDSNGGSSVESIIATGGSTIELPEPTKNGNTFLGWYTDRTNGEKVTSTIMPNEDKTYYAHWSTNNTLIFKVGDLVEMTPSLETYIVDTSKTGNNITEAEVINPRELNLWRIIKVNQDGSAEAVSEYTSSTPILFKGVQGYKNYVSYLNELSSKYINSNFTNGFRNVGYNNQTLIINDTSAFDGTSNIAPWNCSTGESCTPNETNGGGDKSYTADIELIKTAYNGSFNSKCANSQYICSYWLSSRFYSYNSETEFAFRGVVAGNSYIYEEGGSIMKSYCGESYCDGWSDYSDEGTTAASIRPIIIFKSGLNPKGKGTSSSPYILE